MSEIVHNRYIKWKKELIMSSETILIEDIQTFRGSRPAGFDLVEYEKGTDPLDGYVLYGFDEIFMLVPQSKAAHAFVASGV